MFFCLSVYSLSLSLPEPSNPIPFHCGFIAVRTFVRRLHYPSLGILLAQAPPCAPKDTAIAPARTIKFPPRGKIQEQWRPPEHGRRPPSHLLPISRTSHPKPFPAIPFPSIPFPSPPFPQTHARIVASNKPVPAELVMFSAKDQFHNLTIIPHTPKARIRRAGTALRVGLSGSSCSGTLSLSAFRSTPSPLDLG